MNLILTQKTIAITLLLFMTLLSSITAKSQTQRIKDAAPLFNKNLLVEYNTHLSRIATHAFPAIVNISSPKTEPPSLGSGFVISNDGYILTNHHVIQNANTINVTLQTNITYPATLIGSDPKTDIALLKIGTKKLPYLEFADSDETKVGEQAIALGHHLTIGPTLTTGIISGVGRNNVGITTYENFIQTDTTINPGNSGGPLLNIYGEVVGINTAILSQTGGNQNIDIGFGFAIPINMAKPIISTLKTHGKIIRAYLGVKIQDLTPEIATAFGINTNQKGALITQVMTNSPAHTAQLENGDIILKFNGKTITSATALRNSVALSPMNKPIQIMFLRGKKEENRYVTLANMPPSSTAPSAPHLGINSLQNSMTLTPLNLKKRKQLKLHPSIQGTLISAVITDGKAHMSGLQENDIMLSVNNNRTASPKIVRQLLKQATKKKRGIVLLIYRNQQNHFILIDQ